jgi:hypothetical protein
MNVAIFEKLLYVVGVGFIASNTTVGTFSKAELPIETILLLGREIKQPHPEKAELPIVVTLFGILIDERALQPANAEFPIDVTEFEIVTEVSFLQFLNVSVGIDVIPSEIITDSILNPANA